MEEKSIPPKGVRFLASSFIIFNSLGLFTSGWFLHSFLSEQALSGITLFSKLCCFLGAIAGFYVLQYKNWARQLMLSLVFFSFVIMAAPRFLPQEKLEFARRPDTVPGKVLSGQYQKLDQDTKRILAIADEQAFLSYAVNLSRVVEQIFFLLQSAYGAVILVYFSRKKIKERFL